MADINLSMGVRQNLLELRTTDKLMAKTNERLASGRDVNEPIDNPVNYFASLNLNDRADGLNARLDGIGQAIQTLKAAESGIKGVRLLIANMEALITQGMDEVDTSARRRLGEQFNQLLEQAQELAKDSRYQGINLIQGNESLTVQFSERFDKSVLTMEGFNISGPGLGGSGVRDKENETPASTVVGVRTINSAASTASAGPVASVSSRSSIASSASVASSGSTAMLSSVASMSSVASIPSLASQGTVGSISAQGVIPSRASQSSFGSLGLVSSSSSIASRPSIASQASSGTVGSLSSKSSIASRSSIASVGSVGSIAAQTIAQEYALTMNVDSEDKGTSAVIGLQSHGTNSTALGEHEIDWGSHKYKDQFKQLAEDIEKFDTALKTELANIATNMSVLTIREEFTEEMRTTLLEGSDKLVLADMNEEGANLLALQTRQQLGLEALSLATQQSQQLLRLLG